MDRVQKVRAQSEAATATAANMDDLRENATMNFLLERRPAVRCAAGAAGELAAAVRDLAGEGAHVLLVVDPTVRRLGLAEEIERGLATMSGLDVFDDLASDPKEASVDAALDLARSRGIDCVVGLGGGSAMDTAKVVAGLRHTEDGCAPWRLGRTPFPPRRTGLVCVPTTAGTGSEATGTSIISEADGTKNWMWGAQLVPDLAVLDPSLTVGLPAFWTFWTGMDALVHAAESRTNRRRFGANDGIAERAVARVAANLPVAVNEPDNLDARAAMLLAATEAGMAIANTGCAVAHNLGHALGSLAGVPHGRAVGIAFRRSLGWTMPGCPDGFDAVARSMGATDRHGLADALDDLAARCGESFALPTEARGVQTKTLATAMLEPANVDIIRATARDAGDDDVEALAAVMLAA